MEMLKVKMQISPTGTFPTKFLPSLKSITQNSKETRFPYGSILPLWGRQIPYTMAKFFSFESLIDQFYSKVFTAPKNSYPKSTQLSITFVSGYIAGIICAIVSQVPDNLISQRAKAENKGKGFWQIAVEQGWKKLMFKGLGTRIIMFGTLTGFQWWIYDSWKTHRKLGVT